ncbi:MAG: hypothetical protein ACD_37C00355G0001 [uncultured bacterium]|nr:MAG: hypothetical protein ACD_37C00355G0001 [uncultured bacterium]
MSVDNPTFVSFSTDGNVIHIDTDKAPVEPLTRLFPGLVNSSDSGFRITCQREGERILIDNHQLETDGQDPEGDALFLEHIVRDELVAANYVTIERNPGDTQSPFPDREA